MRLTALTALAAALLISPAAANGYTWEPPSWFKAGVAVVKARGGTCKPSGSTFHNPDSSGGPGETVVSNGEDCSHSVAESSLKSSCSSARASAKPPSCRRRAISWLHSVPGPDGS
jgi:hypothetical protein